MKFLLGIACLLAVFTMQQSYAKSTANQHQFTKTIDSKYLNEPRKLHIYLPEDYYSSEKNSSEKTYPVLYMTDGRANLSHTISSAQFLANNGQIPPLIIVGIETTQNRTHNLTPAYTPGSLSVLPFGEGLLLQQNPGGAATFLNFVAHEVKPFIQRNYKTTHYSVFAGHSFGGLFAFYAMTEQPSLFNGYNITSPSLWWDNQSMLDKLELLVQEKKLTNKSIYLSVGDEGDIMLTPFKQAKQLLSSSQRLQFTSEVFMNEDHKSVVLQSHYRGLKAIFKDYTLTLDHATKGKQEIHQYKANMLDKYGVAPALENSLVNLAFDAAFTQPFAKSVDVFKRVIELYPTNYNAYVGLASLYEKQQKIHLAIKTYKQASENKAIANVHSSNIANAINTLNSKL